MSDADAAPPAEPLTIAMLSPYALTRPGGVQGQVIGLANALRELGHRVTVLCPADKGERLPESVGDHVVVGRPIALSSNGSVAPVAFWPNAVAAVERTARSGGFDVLHAHEPLAPMAAYGLVLTAPLPMVGTYHRAGVSRWVPILTPLVELVGRRMQVKVAVSEAARVTGERSSGGSFEVLFNGVDVHRFETADPVRDEHGRPTVLFLGRHELRKGLNVLLDAFERVERSAVLWVAGDGPCSEVERRRHPASDRVQWLGVLSEDEVAARLAGAHVLCAPSLHGESFGMVLLEGLAAGCAVVASDIDGYRAAAGGHASLVPPGDVDALARALGVALADAVEGSGLSSPDARKAAVEYARGWSMDTLAERYVDVYRRAIAAYWSGHPRRSRRRATS